jgi:hypothetical protein
MAKFKVSNVFRFSSRSEFVFAGSASEEKIEPGIVVRIPLQGELYSCVPIIGVESIYHSDDKVSDVGLRCSEQSEQDAEVYSDLCPPGTVVEVGNNAE